MATRTYVLTLALVLALCGGAAALLGTPDGSTFTDGTTPFLGPTGGEFNDSATTVSSGKAGVCRITSKRALHVNLRDNSGAESGVAANPLQCSLANTGANAAALKVDGSAVTQPVSGTVTANAGSGTFTVDGSGHTQPVSGTVTANAGSGTFTNQQTNQTADYDTGAGTQTTTMFGLALPASGGPVAGGTATNPVRVDPTGGTTQPVSGTVTVTPSGTQDVNVKQVNGTTQTGRDWSPDFAKLQNIPSSPATDRTTAGGPFSTELSDGSAFYTATKTGQLPAALDGSGFLKTHEQGTATVSGTVAATQGTGAAASAPWADELSDGASFYTAAKTGQFPSALVGGRLDTNIGAIGNVAPTEKAAASPPTVADTALVTALSPNNTGLPVTEVTVVQKTAGKSTGSVASLAIAYAGNVIQSNTLVVTFCNGNANAAAAPITDTLSQTWRQVVSTANGSAFECGIYVAAGITAGGAETITITPGGSNASIAGAVYEFAGALGVNVAQGTENCSNTGTGTSATCSVTTSLGPNALYLAAVGLGTGAQTITPGGQFANDSGQQNPTTPAGLFSFVAMSRAIDFQGITASATFTSEPWALVGAIVRAPLLPVGAVAMLYDGTGSNNFGAVNSSNEADVSIDHAAPTALADGAANPSLHGVGAYQLVYNGSTWDRLREAIHGANTAGTGIPAAQLLGEFDDVSPTSISENQFGNLRIAANRNLYTTLRDAAGNERGANVTAGNALSVSVDGFTASNASTNVAQIAGTAPTEKAASTPSAATDTSLIVQENPVAAPVCTSFIAISQTASTKIVAGSSGKKFYICAVLLVANAAETVSLVEGTQASTACDTGATAIFGSTTTANGMSLAANGGFAMTSPRPFLVTKTGTDDLCLMQNGSSRVTGGVSYVLQ